MIEGSVSGSRFFCQIVCFRPSRIFSTGGSTMAQGTVKWFNEKKGFGFIQQDGGGDLFVHYTAIKAAGFRSLQEGQRVQFEVETTDRGPKAKNVEMI
jgi:CspA family cold shock protein